MNIDWHDKKTIYTIALSVFSIVVIIVLIIVFINSIKDAYNKLPNSIKHSISSESNTENDSAQAVDNSIALNSVILDTDKISITVDSYVIENAKRYKFNISVINNTDNSISISLNNKYINNITSDEVYMQCGVDANSSGVSSITFNTSGNTYDTAKFTFNVMDNNTLQGVYSSGTVAIQINGDEVTILKTSELNSLIDEKEEESETTLENEIVEEDTPVGIIENSDEDMNEETEKSKTNIKSSTKNNKTEEDNNEKENIEVDSSEYTPSETNENNNLSNITTVIGDNNIGYITLPDKFIQVNEGNSKVWKSPMGVTTQFLLYQNSLPAEVGNAYYQQYIDAGFNKDVIRTKEFYSNKKSYNYLNENAEEVNIVYYDSAYLVQIPLDEGIRFNFILTSPKDVKSAMVITLTFPYGFESADDYIRSIISSYRMIK